MNLLRSPELVERPDPTFRKYFDWPTHKDPKGTVKTQTVLEGTTTSLPSKTSRGIVKGHRKKKMALKTPMIQNISDEDFHLLEAFILEFSVPDEDQVKFSFILIIFKYHIFQYLAGFCTCYSKTSQIKRWGQRSHQDNQLY